MRLGNALLYVAALAFGFVAYSLAAPAQGEDEPVAGTGDVLTMDVDFLREKLLKIWVIEEASDRHNQRRIAEKSFTGMTPLTPTGDPELDAENRAVYLKNDKHLRHYLLLELDNCIEAVDICKRVLGLHLKPPSGGSASRAFFEQELPDIAWSGKTLADAFADLGRRIGTPVDFSGVADNQDIRIDLEIPAGFLLQQALELIQGIHYVTWEYVDGRLVVKYAGG